MCKLLSVLIIVLCFSSSGCYYSGINGKVVDNTTGQPIEGAVVVAQWTKSRGIPGMPIHDPHKIIETLTSKEGAFFLSGTFGLLIDPPEMIIYKEGFIPWRNDMIFPGGRDRLAKDHEWKNNMTYKLDIFTNKYSLSQLYNFLDHGIIGGGAYETPIFSELMRKTSKLESAEIENKMINKK